MSRPRHPRTRRATWATLTLVGALALAGCDSVGGALGGGGSDAQPAADALAAALTSGDFAKVDLATGSASSVAKQYDAVVGDLVDADVKPRVEAGEASVTGSTAQVDLTWSWPVAGTTWRYTAPATLTKAGDAWTVTFAPSLVEPRLRAHQVLSLTTLLPRRGDILGAGGSTIVTDRPVTRFGIDKSQTPKARLASSAAALARLVGVDVAPYVKTVSAAGDLAFVPAITFRSDQVPPDVASGLAAIKGARAVADSQALAPTKEFAAPILGVVGEATAEQIKDDPETYHLGDVVGLSGLQLRYDDQLRGTPGAVVEAVDPADEGNGPSKTLERVAPRNGRPLRLTLDPRLETLAERLLAGVGPASALVAIRPSTGAVLAAANGPGNDGLNLATYGQEAPGSTFKTVSSLALLRAGLTPSSTVPCTPSITVDGKVFTNYSDYPSSALGQVPLRTAVANSCNTAFISQAGKVGKGELAAAAASLGFGVDHDVGFPSFFGSVPAPRTETEAAADLIGQGTILASPMAMASVIGAVEHGAPVVPHLVDGVTAEPPADAAPLTGAEDAALRSMLRGVVTSGSGRGLLGLPGPPVIAKTGTAEFSRDGKTLTHAWMIAAQGDLAVAVFVDVGESGSGTAGPILEAFLRGAR